MLIVTHDLPYAAQLCDRAVVMDGGAVVADGPINSILNDAALLEANRLELPWGFVVPSTLIHKAQSARQTQCLRGAGQGGSPHRASSAFSITSGSAG